MSGNISLIATNKGVLFENKTLVLPRGFPEPFLGIQTLKRSIRNSTAFCEFETFLKHIY